MNQYKTSAELKANAKEALLGKYGVSVSASFLYISLTYIITEISQIFLLVPGIVGKTLYYLSIFAIAVFTGIFAYGLKFFFLKIACKAPVKVSDIYYGFTSNLKEILKAQFFISLISYVAFLPYYIFNEIMPSEKLADYIGLYFILFGLGLLGEFVVMLLYNQTFFIMLDFPNYDAKKALAFSKELMKGNKGRFIYLIVSFLPLMLLGMLTCCIGYLWLIPYVQTTYAYFYLDLVQNKH